MLLYLTNGKEIDRLLYTKHKGRLMRTCTQFFVREVINVLLVLDLEVILFVMCVWRLRLSRGSVLAFGTQVRGFRPGRSRWIFQDEKILSTPSFGVEVKPSVPCRRFTACKRSLNVTWKSGIFRQNSSAISRPSSSSFHY